jgi:uncharacterized membrane protein
MAGSNLVLLAAIGFVGSHFLLSHPLRQPLVASLGEFGFQVIYSGVAFITSGLLIWAYVRAPVTTPLWPVGSVLWAVVTLIMLLASVLLMGSIIRNPALPNFASATAPAEARGVFAITRHPMMWSFALWAACHIAVYPVSKNIVLAGAIIVLALVGAALQDRKKERLKPELWRAWEAKTSYWPFVAIVHGRARFAGWGMHTLGGGVAVWLAASWAHIPVSGVAAGIWRWVY